MFDLDFQYLLYLFSRLSPFLIASFFILQSIFRQEIKCIVYLAGLILAYTFNILLGSFPGLQSINAKTRLPDSRYSACRLIEFSGGPISYLPLGMTTLSFTFFYLLYTVLIFSTPAVLLSSLVIGGGVGVLWSYIVNIIGNPNLQIITGTNPNITCNRPSSVSYLVKKDQIQITQ